MHVAAKAPLLLICQDDDRKQASTVYQLKSIVGRVSWGGQERLWVLDVLRLCRCLLHRLRCRHGGSFRCFWQFVVKREVNLVDRVRGLGCREMDR